MNPKHHIRLFLAGSVLVYERKQRLLYNKLRVSCLEHCRSQLEQIVLAKPAALYTAVSYYLRQNAKKEVQELLMIIRQARFQYPFQKILSVMSPLTMEQLKPRRSWMY